MYNLVRLGPGDQPAHLEEARALFREYAASLGYDLGFQGFTRELEELPGQYAPPKGCLVLALPGGGEPKGESLDRRRGETAAGCAALRPLGGEICEMKRLYVRPRYRGLGVGRALCLYLIEGAARMGYRLMRLDTLSSMKEAGALYRSLGFREIAPYYHNPLPDPLFFERSLVQGFGPETTAPSTRPSSASE
jgi:putative acetyltransferase